MLFNIVCAQPWMINTYAAKYILNTFIEGQSIFYTHMYILYILDKTLARLFTVIAFIKENKLISMAFFLQNYVGLEVRSVSASLKS